MAIYDARDYRSLEALRLYVDNGVLQEAKRLDASDDEPLPLVAPSLCDVQINGYAGIDFNDEHLTEEAWRWAIKRLREDGCSEFCVALITCDPEELKMRMHRIVELGRQTRGWMGLHLEGPFLNPSEGTRGVHPPSAMRKIEAYEDYFKIIEAEWVRVVTLAPECGEEANVRAFIQACVERGIRVAGGHSAVDTLRLLSAVQAGLSGWTHLGNAMGHREHKFEHVFWRVLAVPDLVVSLIADGWHLPVPVFRAFALALGDRMLLTTDAMAGAGMMGESLGEERKLTSSEVRLSGCVASIEKSERTGVENLFGPVSPRQWERWAPWMRRLEESVIERHGQWVPKFGGAISRAVDADGRLSGSLLRPYEAVREAAWMLGVPWTVLWDSYSERVHRWLGRGDGGWLCVGSVARWCMVECHSEVSIVSAIG